MSDKNNKRYEPFVSVALITHNGKEVLRKQLDSIIDQTYSNFEIVISNDGNDSGTIAILNEYTNKDKRIRWSRNPLPAGYMNNIQNAISLCKGEIIFLCDQDDIWFKDKIALHVDAYKDPSVYWVYNKLVLTDQNGKETGYLEDTLPDYYSKNRMHLLYYTWGSCIGGAMTSYRASLLHKVMPIGKYSHGHDSWIQLAIFPKKAFFIDKVLQTYRQHGGNSVGWGKALSKEEFVRNEKQAISDNFRYLKELSKNKTISMWKRSLFSTVYVLKRIRALVLQ